MKTWQVRNWLSIECCGHDGVVEVETDAAGNMVHDGDRVRCVRHGNTGRVWEREGHMVVRWDDEEEDA